VNWKAARKVTSVKNQGKCGCCWAFGTIAAFESLNLIINTGAGNATSDFSEQQQVNCNTYNFGCNGGDAAVAIDWAYFNGATTEANYPYTSENGLFNLGANSCKSLPSVFKAFGALTVPRDVISLMNAIALQPVTVAVYSSNWFSYAGGIFSDCPAPGTGVNHLVLAVGYTSNYWILKNSWGTGWGSQGYMLLDKTNSNCAAMITFDANYPLRVPRTADVSPYCPSWTSYCGSPSYLDYMMRNFFLNNIDS
jgi:C1A family cysteine protease